ncbi:MAG: signal peptidase II [Proteobacteria bacterium SW_6_67_9]|nr:MAG: signal peptidase II [Proteobacteria bacterium SW_6_67_9]
MVLHPSLPWFALAGGVVVVDQLAKWAAVATLRLHAPVAVAPFFDLTLVRNEGAAFSILAGAGGWQRWVLVGLALAIAGAIALWLARGAWRRRPTATALALVLGGALGNVIDRARLGYVIDYLDFHAAGYHWPAFNVADAAITGGALLLVLLALTGRE